MFKVCFTLMTLQWDSNLEDSNCTLCMTQVLMETLNASQASGELFLFAGKIDKYMLVTVLKMLRCIGLHFVQGRNLYLLSPLCIYVSYLVARGMCDGSCILYILSLFPHLYRLSFKTCLMKLFFFSQFYGNVVQ